MGPPQSGQVQEAATGWVGGADERGSYVLGADVWADVGPPAVAKALHRALTGRAP